jgi:hypothetical protein
MTFHHFLLFHLHLSLTYLACLTQIQIMRMMMMRRRSRDEQQIGRRPKRGTDRDRSRAVPLAPLATPSPLIVRVVHVLTPTTTTIMVQG